MELLLGEFCATAHAEFMSPADPLTEIHWHSHFNYTFHPPGDAVALEENSQLISQSSHPKGRMTWEWQGWGEQTGERAKELLGGKYWATRGTEAHVL